MRHINKLIWDRYGTKHESPNSIKTFGEGCVQRESWWESATWFDWIKSLKICDFVEQFWGTFLGSFNACIGETGIGTLRRLIISVTLEMWWILHSDSFQKCLNGTTLPSKETCESHSQHFFFCAETTELWCSPKTLRPHKTAHIWLYKVTLQFPK